MLDASVLEKSSIAFVVKEGTIGAALDVRIAYSCILAMTQRSLKPFFNSNSEYIQDIMIDGTRNLSFTSKISTGDVESRESLMSRELPLTLSCLISYQNGYQSMRLTIRGCRSHRPCSPGMIGGHELFTIGASLLDVSPATKEAEKLVFANFQHSQTSRQYQFNFISQTCHFSRKFCL
jgi:hypothetical protein